MEKVEDWHRREGRRCLGRTGSWSLVNVLNSQFNKKINRKMGQLNTGAGERPLNSECWDQEFHQDQILEGYKRGESIWLCISDFIGEAFF